ncbi:formate-dependent nitrite reductase membrane component NrfD [Kineosphaera limosa]|nr:NrfD/PsrC family molybdoenzyme membrane anchor subunit [Kineosphaera limosa]NYD99695.1 formate-dependent nitrite reductase membrane component NrfD [Kineosphaera limosa]
MTTGNSQASTTAYGEAVTFTPRVGQVQLRGPADDPVGEGPAGTGRDGRRGGRRRKRQRDDVMVPQAQFSSYYGRPIVKPAPWSWEIPAYLYLGGLAAGSALVASGAEMTGRRELQRNARLIALGALGGSTAALVSDLGKPSRFLNMMRTVKLTSPMSVGSWILAGFGTFTGIAAFSEVMHEVLPPDVPGRQLWPIGDRLTSIGAAMFAPPLAAYTAVLLADTATPTWHAAYRELPFVFVGSALASAGGAAMITTHPDQTAPARTAAVVGSVLELSAHQIMERRMGMLAEPLHEGRPGKLLTAAKALTVAGAALTVVAGRRRPLAALAGVALNVGSALTRFGVFYGGIASAKDPKYTVIPQRQRLAEKQAALAHEQHKQQEQLGAHDDARFQYGRGGAAGR